MWIFVKDNQSWTCPDSSLIEIARIQASDRKDGMKDKLGGLNIPGLNL